MVFYLFRPGRLKCWTNRGPKFYIGFSGKNNILKIHQNNIHVIELYTLISLSEHFSSISWREQTTLDGNDVLFVLDHSRDYHSRDSLFYDVLFVLDHSRDSLFYDVLFVLDHSRDYHSRDSLFYDVLFVLDHSRDYHSRDSLFYDVLFVLDQHVEVGLSIY